MSKIDLSANSNNLLYPEWVVLHVPHDSTIIPASVRSQFLLGDSQLVAVLLVSETQAPEPGSLFKYLLQGSGHYPAATALPCQF